MAKKIRQSLNSCTLPWPVNWVDIFGAARPLIVEIGFGQGNYLFNLARQHPDANVIGLEVSNKSLVKAERGIVRHNLTNVCTIYSRAETALHHLFEPATITEIHINFPDPWFKSNHHHRRLMQRDTLDAMVSRLIPGGTLYLATDIREYAEMSAELLAETPGLDNLYPTPWIETAPPGRFMTKYEAKAISEGRIGHYFAYRRNDSPPPPVPVSKELDMPHIVFTTPLDLDSILAQFQPAEYDFGETHVRLMEAFRGHHSLLFEVYVKEPTIDQRVAVVLVYHADADDYTLKLGRLGNPRPTDGIHKAIGALGEWLLSLHPESAIVKDTVRR